MRRCQWPDEDNVPCGKPAAKRMFQYGTRPNGTREEYHYCVRHMRPSRQRRVEAAGWMVVTAY